MEPKIEETFNSKIEFEIVDISNGFSAPDLPPNLKEIIRTSSKDVFEGNEPVYAGCGGSIPFMEVISQLFPSTLFILTGCGLLSSNAHAANESLDLEYCRKFTTTIALILSRL